MSTQAERIISKFGGAIPLAAHLGYTKQAVYRWTYPKERRGSAGIIPGPVIPDIQALAVKLGVELSAEDWTP